MHMALLVSMKVIRDGSSITYIQCTCAILYQITHSKVMQNNK